ncbi:hypothetical protein AB0395_16975 [Streptosporangium sp. NPDC051023]|uniref:hypothetical protein n=1 Tax=Streptosporangium sp. NPDC051023 TaxID=3155410 RepID=UPI00345056AF
MRRSIAMVTAALLASALAVAAPATAQAAAPADPVKALQRQLRPGHGIQITETNRSHWKHGSVTVRRSDILQFDRSGIAAVDVVRRATSSPPLGKKNPVNVQRTITVGGRNYHYDPSMNARLPKGKTWVRDSRENGKWSAVFGDQVLNVLEPATLGFMLRTSARRLPDRGGVQYRGTITWAQLFKVSRSFHEQWSFIPLGKAGRSKIKWRLWLDATGLPARLVTEDTFGGLVDNAVNDIRYTGWGSRVVVTAPPADRVIDELDVDYTPEPPTPLNVLIEGAGTTGSADARLSPRPDAGREEVSPEADGGREETPQSENDGDGSSSRPTSTEWSGADRRQ